MRMEVRDASNPSRLLGWFLYRADIRSGNHDVFQVIYEREDGWHDMHYVVLTSAKIMETDGEVKHVWKTSASRTLLRQVKGFIEKC